MGMLKVSPVMKGDTIIIHEHDIETEDESKRISVYSEKAYKMTCEYQVTDIH